MVLADLVDDSHKERNVHRGMAATGVSWLCVDRSLRATVSDVWTLAHLRRRARGEAVLCCLYGHTP
jgi:hypothetical protein